MTDTSTPENDDLALVLRQRFSAIDASQTPLTGAEIRERADLGYELDGAANKEEVTVVDLAEARLQTEEQAESPAGEGKRRSRSRRRVGMLIAAAAVVLAAVLAAVLLDDDGSEVVTTDDAVVDFSADPPEVLRQTASAQRGEEPWGLPAVEAGTYRLTLIDGAVLDVQTNAEDPFPFFYLPIESGEVAREVFLPAAAGPEDFAEVYASYGQPLQRHPIPSLFWFPFVEVVSMPSLGTTTQAVTDSILAADGLTVVEAPTPTTVGGTPAITFDVRSDNRLVIASTDSPGVSGSPPILDYQEGSHIRFFIVDAPAGPVVAAISTDEQGFESWVTAGESFLDNLVFAPPFG